MLVLSRKVGESIVIGDSIEVHVLETKGRGRQVRLGISADRSIPVRRKEMDKAHPLTRRVSNGNNDL